MAKQDDLSTLDCSPSECPMNKVNGMIKAAARLNVTIESTNLPDSLMMLYCLVLFETLLLMRRDEHLRIKCFTAK